MSAGRIPPRASIVYTPVRAVTSTIVAVPASPPHATPLESWACQSGLRAVGRRGDDGFDLQAAR
jgi:hypothetical protein